MSLLETVPAFFLTKVFRVRSALLASKWKKEKWMLNKQTKKQTNKK